MSDVGILGADIHRRDGVGAGDVVEHQGLAGNRRLRVLRRVVDDDGGTVGADTAILTDGTGVDVGAGILSSMDDLRTGIEVLALAGEGNAGELHMGVVALQDGHRIEVGNMGAEGSGYPLHRAALFDDGTLRVQVIHILRPVLDGRVAKLRILADIELDAAGMQVRDVVLRCRAALDEVELCPLIHDDQGMLELSGARGVQTEVGLQRDLDGDALRDIDEGAAGPDRTMECRELMIRRRYEVHEVIPDHICIRTVQGRLDVGIYDALLLDLLLEVMIDELRVVLCADAGE